MKKILLAALVTISVAGIVSCTTSSDNDSEAIERTAIIDTVSVDRLLSNPEAYVNKQIYVAGICRHLCFNGGRQAYITGKSGSNILKCDALAAMKGRFPDSCKNKPILVAGIFREQRIDESALQSMEQQHIIQVASINDEQGPEAAAIADKAPGECEIGRAAVGQKDIDNFQDRMADYRSRIAERNSKEGKPYLSFYYLDTDYYKLLK